MAFTNPNARTLYSVHPKFDYIKAVDKCFAGIHSGPHRFACDVLRGHHFNVSVDIGDLVPHGKGVQFAANVNGKLHNLPLRRTGPQSYSGLYKANEIGTLNLKVLFDDVLVKEANVNVKRGYSAAKCIATGEGLKSVVVGKPAKFDVNVQNAGDGELFVQFLGPEEAKSKCRDNGDGVCVVEYVAPVAGNYTIGILYGKEGDEQHIPGSPFNVVADMPYDPSCISVNGLVPHAVLEVRAGSPVSFDIDASQTREGPISVSVPPIYQQPLLEKDKANPRVYHARFTPVGEAGSMVPVEIMYEGKPIPNSPFHVKLLPETDLKKVKICAPDGSSHYEIHWGPTNKKDAKCALNLLKNSLP